MVIVAHSTRLHIRDCGSDLYVEMEVIETFDCAIGEWTSKLNQKTDLYSGGSGLSEFCLIEVKKMVFKKSFFFLLSSIG